MTSGSEYVISDKTKSKDVRLLFGKVGSVRGVFILRDKTRGTGNTYIGPGVGVMRD